MSYFDKRPSKPCVVVVSLTGAKCGGAHWGWTNRMESLCLEHFRQRSFLQTWMVMQQGHSWAALVVRQNPQGFFPLEESEESQKRRNLSHIRKIQDQLRGSLDG